MNRKKIVLNVPLESYDYDVRSSFNILDSYTELDAIKYAMPSDDSSDQITSKLVAPHDEPAIEELDQHSNRSRIILCRTYGPPLNITPVLIFASSIKCFTLPSISRMISILHCIIYRCFYDQNLGIFLYVIQRKKLTIALH